MPTSEAWSSLGANDVPSVSRTTFVPGVTTTWPCFTTAGSAEELLLNGSLNRPRGMAIAKDTRQRTLMPPITMAATEAVDARRRYDRWLSGSSAE